MREVFGIGCMDARGVLATVGSEGNLAGFWQGCERGRSVNSWWRKRVAGVGEVYKI